MLIVFAPFHLSSVEPLFNQEVCGGSWYRHWKCHRCEVWWKVRIARPVSFCTWARSHGVNANGILLMSVCKGQNDSSRTRIQHHGSKGQGGSKMLIWLTKSRSYFRAMKTCSWYMVCRKMVGFYFGVSPINHICKIICIICVSDMYCDRERRLLSSSLWVIKY